MIIPNDEGRRVAVRIGYPSADEKIQLLGHLEWIQHTIISAIDRGAL